MQVTLSQQHFSAQPRRVDVNARTNAREQTEHTHTDRRAHHSHGKQGNAASTTDVKTGLETRAYSGLPEELLRSIGV